MPHKHTRKREDQSSTINLPPSEIAHPLSVSKSANSNGIFTSRPSSSSTSASQRTDKKRKRNRDAVVDDTPKAFARLLAFQRGEKLPKGLDDGIRNSQKASKKRKQAKDSNAETQKAIAVTQQDGETPSIRPGERMSDFAARVDAALPVSGLIKKTVKNGKDTLGLKVSRTKTEKRMHRMYDEWREEEKRLKEKQLDAMELAEEEALDEDGQVKWKVDIEAAKLGSQKKNRNNNKTKKKKVIGEIDEGDDDPWDKLKRDRAEKKIGLNDVVQAPPSFSKTPREKFKVRGARVEVDDVPKASGSLRRREELGDVRKSVVEGYRQMMKDNRANSGGMK